VTGRTGEPAEEVPWEPLERVLTGRPDEVPDAAPDEVLCDPLLRVLTGRLWLGGAEDVLCDPLPRVATGAAEAVL
jgi:hypothetical protein